MDERLKKWKIEDLKRKIHLAKHKIEDYTFPKTYGRQKELRYNIDEKRAIEIIKKAERELDKLIKQ